MPLTIWTEWWGLALTPVKVDGPDHAGNAADAKQVVVGDGFQIIDVANIGVHHPDVAPMCVVDRAGRTEHHAAKNGTLLGNQKAYEADAEILVSISYQHLQRDPGHEISNAFKEAKSLH